MSVDAIAKLLEASGVPGDFVDHLIHESDWSLVIGHWSLVIKLHALFEAVLANLSLQHHQAHLERLEHSAQSIMTSAVIAQRTHAAHHTQRSHGAHQMAWPAQTPPTGCMRSCLPAPPPPSAIPTFP